MENIKYSTSQLERYFSRNRVRWDQFYESERVVIERIWPGNEPAMLDIGCGCGGLGLALAERFGARRYTGVEINPQAAASASHLYPNARILSGDFLKLGDDSLAPETFDMVFSLSCIDWNFAFDAMFAKAWAMVKPGGVFIASFRLTTQAGINDGDKSFQYINYDGGHEGEIAPYVVLNAADLMHRLRTLAGAQRVFAYGYYGPPSQTAVTPYKELCFAVLAIRKSIDSCQFESELLLPADITDIMLAIR